MEKDNFYLKKLGKRGRISIWLVDGRRIRSDLDREFTNFGQHFRFPFIPENEFWIDKEAVPDERRFFIDRLLLEWRLMKKGKPYYVASELADAKERSERERTADYRKIVNQKSGLRAQRVHRRLLKNLKNGIVVWLVDGRLVRTLFKVSFTEGGHDLVYHFVPKNEVWIDNDVIIEERPYVILHELLERFLMSKGLSYARAHRKASQREWETRRQPETLKKILNSLGWKD